MIYTHICICVYICIYTCIYVFYIYTHILSIGMHMLLACMHAVGLQGDGFHKRSVFFLSQTRPRRYTYIVSMHIIPYMNIYIYIYIYTCYSHAIPIIFRSKQIADRPQPYS